LAPAPLGRKMPVCSAPRAGRRGLPVPTQWTLASDPRAGLASPAAASAAAPHRPGVAPAPGPRSVPAPRPLPYSEPHSLAGGQAGAGRPAPWNPSRSRRVSAGSARNRPASRRAQAGSCWSPSTARAICQCALARSRVVACGYEDDPSCATSLGDALESKHSIQQPTGASRQTTRRTCGVPPLCLQPVEMLRDERVNPPIEGRVRVRVSEDGHRRYACTPTAGSISATTTVQARVTDGRRSACDDARKGEPPPCAPRTVCVRVRARMLVRARACVRERALVHVCAAALGLHATRLQHGGVSHAAWYSCLPRTLGTSSPCHRRSPPLRAHPTHVPCPRAQPTRIGPKPLAWHCQHSRAARSRAGVG
jgi:hypothetical protein